MGDGDHYPSVFVGLGAGGMNWILHCPQCGKEFISYYSTADSRELLRAHLLRVHPDLIDPRSDPMRDERP